MTDRTDNRFERPFEPAPSARAELGRHKEGDIRPATAEMRSVYALEYIAAQLWHIRKIIEHRPPAGTG
jgi:hypothetical protein